jgi:hypothetical protein
MPIIKKVFPPSSAEIIGLTIDSDSNPSDKMKAIDEIENLLRTLSDEALIERYSNCLENNLEHIIDSLDITYGDLLRAEMALRFYKKGIGE